MFFDYLDIEPLRSTFKEQIPWKVKVLGRMDGSQAQDGVNSTLRPRELSRGSTTWKEMMGPWQVVEQGGGTVTAD